jgi:hypothetical protein
VPWCEVIRLILAHLKAKKVDSDIAHNYNADANAGNNSNINSNAGSSVHVTTNEEQKRCKKCGTMVASDVFKCPNVGIENLNENQ